MSYRKNLRENGLSLVLVLLAAATIAGLMAAGNAVHNEDLMREGGAPLPLGKYLTTGHFMEAFFENCESEFLQMGALVLLAAKLRQKGSSESKRLDGEDDSDEDPSAHRNDPTAPWPVRSGGLALTVYEHSLSLALFSLFAVCFAMHAYFGLRLANEERAREGQTVMSLLDYIRSSRFWFESFQNWQSEFLAVLALIVLSIFLRERGSSQSKPVAAPHAKTGH
jgi:hypothetical protein